VEVIDTLADKESLERYWQLVKRFRIEKPRVPIYCACERVKVGFTSESKSGAAIEDLFAIHAYVRSTCPHCRDAKRFLSGLEKRWRGIRIVFHDVDREAGAIGQMTKLARQYGVTAPSFPVISVCGRVVSGYSTDSITGRQIEELLWKTSTYKLDHHSIKPERAASQHWHALPFSDKWREPSLVASALNFVAGGLPQRADR
jgi:glutaredoxin